MIWFIIENWFWLVIGSAYVGAIFLAYVRFGRSAAVAVALLGAGAFLYRKGESDAQVRYQQRQEQARREREEVEQNVGAMGEEDVQRELGKWNRD